MNVTQFLIESGVEIREAGEHHHAHQGWVQVDCPFCSPNSHSFRMGVSLTRRKVNCWVCGWHPYVLAITELTGKLTRDVFKIIDDLDPAEAAARRTGHKVVPPHTQTMHKAHKEYLRMRGFDPDKIEEDWGVTGIRGDAGRLSWRLYIPIPFNGQVVSWTTRSISDQAKPRYISARPNQESVPHKEILYGEELCRNAIVVVEGPLDVWAVGPGAVCTFGTSYSEVQEARIARYPVRVVAFDNEPQAQRSARKLARDLSAFKGETFTVVLSGKDAAESRKEEIRELREMFLE